MLVPGKPYQPGLVFAVKTRDHIHSTFSSLLMNGPNKLECCMERLASIRYQYQELALEETA